MHSRTFMSLLSCGLLLWILAISYGRADPCSGVTGNSSYTNVNTIYEFDCTFTQDSFDDSYHLTDARWIYYANTPSDYVTIQKVDIEDKNFIAFMSVDCKGYYAGTYECQVTYTSNDTGDCTASQTVQIATAEGKALGDQCSADSDCLALNADCALYTDGNNYCQCQDPYSINADDSKDTSACLSTSNFGGLCNLDSQCSYDYYTSNFFCVDDECKCNLTATWVKVENTSYLMCIEKVKPAENCTYNEQCQIFDPHTTCHESVCTCNSDWNDGLDSDGRCTQPWELSDADIAYIAVGAVLAFGIVCIIIRCLAEKCCCQGGGKSKDEEAIEEKFN